jgi:hypothetical protein
MRYNYEFFTESIFKRNSEWIHWDDVMKLVLLCDKECQHGKNNAENIAGRDLSHKWHLTFLLNTSKRYNISQENTIWITT